MADAVSSTRRGRALGRLRTVLLIRAYNYRGPDQTLGEQFAEYKDAQGLLTKSGIRSALQLSAQRCPRLEDLLENLPSGGCEYGAFMEFLETGEVRRVCAPWPRSFDCREPPQQWNPGSTTSMVPHRGLELSLAGRDTYRRPGPGRPVWRKRETLIQERIVQYTTIDEAGQVQELLETEKSQTEVLHMECKDTGDFAHRESTEYESGEAFNGEFVLQESGSEQYVHFRSNDDEYEHFDSCLPTRAHGGGQQQAPQAGPASPPRAHSPSRSTGPSRVPGSPGSDRIPRSPGRTPPGPRSPGPRSPGPRSPGPRSPGPRSPGPRSAGPRSPGPTRSAWRVGGHGNAPGPGNDALPRPVGEPPGLSDDVGSCPSGGCETVAGGCGFDFDMMGGIPLGGSLCGGGDDGTVASAAAGSGGGGAGEVGGQEGQCHPRPHAAMGLNGADGMQAPFGGHETNL